MKKILFTLAFCLVAISAMAANLDIDLTKKQSAGFKYLEVKTSKSVFRVYPCGKIEKKMWKEIHENEDTMDTFSSTTLLYDPNYTTTP